MIQPSQSQLDDVIAGMRKKSDTTFARAGAVADTIEQNRRAAGDLKVPETKPLPEAPKPEIRDPLQAFGSTASIIGILGSLLTRRPLTHALNAASGVMGAYRENDLQQAKFQMDTWRANMENAKTLHDWQMDTYKAAIAKLDTDSKTALSELQAYASAFKDENMLAVIQSRNVADIYKYVEQSRAQWTRMESIMPKLEEENERQTEWLQWKKEHPNATNEEQISQRNGIWHPTAARAAGETPEYKRLKDMFDKASIDFRTAQTSLARAEQIPFPSKERDAAIASATERFNKAQAALTSAQHDYQTYGQATPPTAPPAAVTPPAAVPPKPAAAPTPASAPPQPGAIPAKASAKEPDGTHIDVGGKHYVKQGDWLVPVAAQTSDARGTPGLDPNRWTGEGGPNTRTNNPREFTHGEGGTNPTYETNRTQEGLAIVNPADQGTHANETQARQQSAQAASELAAMGREPTSTGSGMSFAARPGDDADTPIPAGPTTQDALNVSQSIQDTFNQMHRDLAATRQARIANQRGMQAGGQQLSQTEKATNEKFDKATLIAQLSDKARQASPASRREILRQLDTHWADASPVQKLLIMQLHMLDYPGMAQDFATSLFARRPAQQPPQAVAGR